MKAVTVVPLLLLACCFCPTLCVIGQPPTATSIDAASLRTKALVEADGGKLQVQGCSFATPEPSILLGKGLKHAIVTGNNGITGVTINNQIGDRAIISGNEPSGPKE